MRTAEPNTRGELTRPWLFGLTAAVVVGILAPLTIPHVLHTSMVYHILLHIASTTVAVFLSIVSFLAYQRNRSARFAFMMAAFMALVIVEVLYLLSASAVITPVQILVANVEVPHLILLAMLALLGLGILRVEKR